MKKILVLILSLMMIMTVFALVACGGDDVTSSQTTPDSTTTNDPDTTTVTQPGETTTAATTTTTAEETTTAVPATPNTTDPALEYHVEQLVVKTNIKDEDRDLGYLYWEDAGENNNERYADMGGYIIYQFDVSEMIEPKIILKVRQMYAIYITDNEEDYLIEDMTEVANFNDTISKIPSDHFLDGDVNGEYINGGNTTDITIDPYQYGYYGKFYVHIVNARPEYGHGGTISQLTIEQYVEGKGPEITTIDNSQGKPYYKPEGAVQIVNEILVNADELDEEYIFENTSSLADNKRYADNNTYIIYRIDLRKMYEPTVELYVAQNYKIEVSPDGKTWVEVANYGTSDDYAQKYATSGSDTTIFNPSGDYLPGDNFTTIIIDPYETTVNGEPLYGNLYIRISDCFPSNGWGGAIEKLTIKHYGIVPDEQ